jgi:hypothetical protein
MGTRKMAGRARDFTGLQEAESGDDGPSRASWTI